MSKYYKFLFEGYPILTPGNYVVDPDGDIYVILDKIEYSPENKWNTNYRIMSLMTGNENNLEEESEFLEQGWRTTSYSIANEYYKKFHNGKELPKNKFNKWYSEHPKPIED